MKAPLEKWQSVKIERKIQKLLSKLLKISKGGATVSSKRLIDDISVVSYRHQYNFNFGSGVVHNTEKSGKEWSQEKDDSMKLIGQDKFRSFQIRCRSIILSNIFIFQN